MSVHARIPVVLTVMGVLLLSAGVAAVTPEERDALVRKLVEIRTRAEAERQPDPPQTARRTVVTEGEINSWLALEALETMPGVTSAEVTLGMDGKVSAMVTIDLETLGTPATGGGLNPLSLLTGLVPVQVEGQLETGVGQGRVVLEQASIAGVVVPESVLQQLLIHYTRTPENPEGVRLSESFALPAGIDRIVIGSGRAIVIQ